MWKQKFVVNTFRSIDFYNSDLFVNVVILQLEVVDSKQLIALIIFYYVLRLISNNYYDEISVCW